MNIELTPGQIRRLRYRVEKCHGNVGFEIDEFTMGNSSFAVGKVVKEPFVIIKISPPCLWAGTKMGIPMRWLGQ